MINEKMGVLIYWSGARSGHVAQMVSDALSTTIPGLPIRVWESESDAVRKRKRQLVNPASGLGWAPFHGISVGILCVTDANQEDPWLNFDAGTMAKQLNAVALLIDVRPDDVSSPLKLLDMESLDKEGLLTVFHRVNNRFERGRRTEQDLKGAFYKLWPSFESKLKDKSSFQLRGLEGMIEELRSSANVRKSDETLKIGGVAIPGGYKKLEEPVDAFFADHERRCSDYDKNVFIMSRFQPGNETLERIDKGNSRSGGMRWFGRPQSR